MADTSSILPSLGGDREGHLPVVVQAWGEAALFTRPAFKTERLSYPVMTPTAAKGLLEAIYWKPQFQYRIAAIEILQTNQCQSVTDIRQFSIRRNETSDVASAKDVLKGNRRVDVVASRDQRNAVCLRDVAYRIYAHLELEPKADNLLAAYRDQLRRRVNRGSCFAQPYFGTREFSAYFAPADNQPRMTGALDVGLMPHTIFHDGSPTTWFHARVEDGLLRIPEHGIVPKETKAT